METKESQQLFNASMRAPRGTKGVDTLTINFRCMMMETARGESGNALLLMQPVAKKEPLTLGLL